METEVSTQPDTLRRNVGTPVYVVGDGVRCDPMARPCIHMVWRAKT
jgi:hypothetical protein